MEDAFCPWNTKVTSSKAFCALFTQNGNEVAFVLGFCTLHPLLRLWNLWNIFAFIELDTDLVVFGFHPTSLDM